MRTGGPRQDSLDLTRYGLQYGIVTQNKDPENLDRIKVRLPWLDPCALMRSLDAGAYGVICPMINTP